MDIEKRVHLAFDDEATDPFREKYLDLLYANWFESVRALRRAVFLALLMALSFLFLNHAEAGALALGPLKTNNLAAVLTVLPAITSFLLFEALDLTVAAANYRQAARTLIYKMYPPIGKHDLELLLEPPTTFAWGGGSSTSLTRSTRRTAKLLRKATVLGFSSTAAIVLLFLGYAYFELFNNDQMSLLGVAGSFIFAAFNLTRAALVLVENAADEGAQAELPDRQ